MHVVSATVGQGKHQTRPSFDIEFTHSVYG
jgi:hypothetical protein